MEPRDAEELSEALSDGKDNESIAKFKDHLNKKSDHIGHGMKGL